MSKSLNLQRQEAYFAFPDSKLREAVYSLGKSMQSHGMTVPQALQDYLDHCDAVKRDFPKPSSKGKPEQNKG